MYPPHPPAPSAPNDPTGPSDAMLMARIHAGDETAFAVLVKRHAKDLTRFAYTIVQTTETAYDVVQTALFRFWQHRGALDHIGSPRAYLFGLVRNCAIDARRTDASQLRRQAMIQSEIDTDARPTSGESHEAAVLEAATLDAALEHLPEARRMAVRLRLDSELTHEEIGDVLGVTTEAARKLVTRGLQDLQKFWGVSG